MSHLQLLIAKAMLPSCITSAGYQQRGRHRQHRIIPAEGLLQPALPLLRSDRNADHPFKVLGSYGKAYRKRYSRLDVMYSIYAMFLAKKGAWEHRWRRQKREGQALFVLSRVLCGTGMPHTFYNIPRESTYTCSSKTPTCVLHGSQSIAWRRNKQSF